jgi:hydroxyacylglutathione hydrolase
VLDTARARGWTITQILNTHHHHDHTGGNAALQAATGAKILAHAGAATLIDGIDTGLGQGDVVRVGRTVELECLDTPGHTLSHVCLFAHTEEPALFCGDTYFNAGAGNCHNGGDPSLLYETFAQRLSQLPDTTRIFAGHDYFVNNLGFTLDREPGNAPAAQLKDRLADVAALQMPVTTLGEEKHYNTFLRLQNAQNIQRLREHFTDLPEHPTPREVFLRLRELRNHW